MVPLATDIDLTTRDVADLASADAIAGLLARLGYDTSARAVLTPAAVGLSGESAAAIKRIELLSEDPERFLRVVFAQSRSLTAKVRNDLARVLGRSNIDHLLVLASDFDTLEFVFLDKRKRQRKGPAGGERIQVVPKSISVDRRHPTRLDLRTLRRFSWTCRDALEQFDKLRSVFDAAAYTGEFFQNRGLFSDHFLRDRLRDDAAWRDNPSEMFAFVRDSLREAQSRFRGKDKEGLRNELLEPLFKRLGFEPKVNRPSRTDQTQPDYLLKGSGGTTLSAAFVYAWDRWLDGPDLNDEDTPEENPGACVVTALDDGVADWIIVTNGRLWRLYSRQAHARATNFYEVDLVEALDDSADTDPNEAFRYWWLFLRPTAFAARPDGAGCWLDEVLVGSREYAKRLGERLKDRIFLSIFPHLAQGFLTDRKQRLGIGKRPTDDELSDVFEATLTLLYRLLFMLYAESRDLLPTREAPYQAASLKRIKEEIAERAGVAESEVAERIGRVASPKGTALYDRLLTLFQAMDKGDPVLNVPTYNGGLFNTSPLPSTPGRGAGGEGNRRDQRIARFLAEHKVPDRHLALAIDLLARDQDERTLALVFIDYKSLEVRHLGSIYEGLLEFKLKVAEEDLTTQADKKAERYVPLSTARPKRGKAAQAVVRRGEVYLSNDKAERKASGSYYTPDPIVEYIVAQTVGPVLDARLDALRGAFRKVRKTFDNEMQKSRAYPSPEVQQGQMEHRQWAGLQTYNHHKDLVERLFDLTVLDPAMGSGHFLVEVVDFVTDRLLKFLNQFPINPVNFALESTRQSILSSLGEQGVTVDPSKLTDINLLKRHVLKRCIYGVDLNPMAVELAKVSLWLDCFTLGAPLNFLDHHLRTGNSLIGATFDDLARVTKASKSRAATLFRIDYEPLLRAIRHVIQLNRLADATAAEVLQSASAYHQVRRELSGYQIVLDLLVAPHFGVRGALGLLEYGSELDLSSSASLLASLKLLPPTRAGELPAAEIIAQVEALAAQPSLRFFHWELEFPEVFFGFADADQRRIEHKDRIQEGSAGFDCVVGNPPYVRMELIKPIKPFLKKHYSCHAERADLFIYFYERAVRLLRSNGYSAFIASSTWTKTKAGEALRAFLKASATIVSYLDFGDLPVFPDATTYPAVMVVRRDPPAQAHLVASALVQDLENLNLGHILESRRIDVPQSELDVSGWSFEDRKIARLREKIRAAGIPLKEYCGSPLYGIKTGLNEAFVIDTHTYERLVAEDRSSKEILKPFLEGKDLKPWRYDWRGLYLIYTHHGIEIDRYPAIKRHLATYRPRLEERATIAHHQWYELQQPQLAYTKAMEGPKIMYPDITVTPRFVYDDRGFYFGNTTYFLPRADRFLQAVLSSHVVWWQLGKSVRLMRGGYLRLFTQYVEVVPVPACSASERETLASIAEALSMPGCRDRLAVEAELNNRVADLYRLTEDERELVRRGTAQPEGSATIDGD